jgi:hypothetical protein
MLIFAAISIVAYYLFLTVGLGITVANWPVTIIAYVIMIFANAIAENLSKQK